MGFYCLSSYFEGVFLVNAIFQGVPSLISYCNGFYRLISYLKEVSSLRLYFKGALLHIIIFQGAFLVKAFAMHFEKKWFVDRRCAWAIFLLQNKDSTAKLTLAYGGPGKLTMQVRTIMSPERTAPPRRGDRILEFLRAFSEYLPHCQSLRRSDEQLEA